MPGNGGQSNREMTHDATCFEFTASLKFTFPPEGQDARNRVLELRLIQPKVDLSRTSFELPLEVFLTEDDGERVYEDTYYYDIEGDFLRHCYRIKNKATGRYDRKTTTKDANRSKLRRCGPQIKDMMKDQTLRLPLEMHPTVQKLKTHSLYNTPEDNANGENNEPICPVSSGNMWYI